MPEEITLESLEMDSKEYEKMFSTLERMRVSISPDPIQAGTVDFYNKLARCREYANEADGLFSILTNRKRMISRAMMLAKMKLKVMRRCEKQDPVEVQELEDRVDNLGVLMNDVAALLTAVEAARRRLKDTTSELRLQSNMMANQIQMLPRVDNTEARDDEEAAEVRRGMSDERIREIEKDISRRAGTVEEDDEPPEQDEDIEDMLDEFVNGSDEEEDDSDDDDVPSDTDDSDEDSGIDQEYSDEAIESLAERKEPREEIPSLDDQLEELLEESPISTSDGAEDDEDDVDVEDIESFGSSDENGDGDEGAEVSDDDSDDGVLGVSLEDEAVDIDELLGGNGDSAKPEKPAEKEKTEKSTDKRKPRKMQRTLIDHLFDD